MGNLRILIKLLANPRYNAGATGEKVLPRSERETWRYNMADQDY